MNKITADDIQKLLSHEGGGVSVYIPTHRHAAPPHMQEDQIRLKNALRVVQEKWAEYGGEWRDIEESIGRLEDLVDSYRFWQNTTESLAIFISKDGFDLYHLPVECEEWVGAGDSFDVTPLLVIYGLNQPYYILALALRNPKLLRGDLYDVEVVNLDMPESPVEALNIDELHANSNIVRSHQQRGAASPHGEGDSTEVGPDERMKYYRIIEQVITSSDDYDDSLPVLLAGTDSEVGDFRGLTQLQNVIQGSYIQGNHIETPTRELYSMARPLIHREYIRPKWQELTEQLGDMAGTGKSSTNPDEIIDAAKQGRVGTLIIDVLEMSRDSVSEVNDEPIPILRCPSDKSFSKITEAALYAARNGGAVYGVKKGRYLEDGIEMAALYRY